MAALIWNNQLQAFAEPVPPLTYNPAIDAWEDTEGLEYNHGLEAWEKIWPGQEYIYRHGQFVRGTYRWFKSPGANQNPKVTIIHADEYMRLNVTNTQTHGVVPIIVFNVPIPPAARSITLKFKWGSGGRPYDFCFRALKSYAENDHNNCAAATSMKNVGNTTDTLVCDISDVNVECYAEIDVWVGDSAGVLFPGCTGENMMLDILELYYE